MKHIISARQFDKKIIGELFSLTDKIRTANYDKKSLAGKIMTTLFYEPSTRTRLSFESAMLRLGGSVIATENAGEFSSAAKGETLEDTIRIVNGYCDIIVMRHFSAGATETAVRYSKIPVINAGDGGGEHPTQALLDLYTIFSKLNTDRFTVAMIGDLANGRTIHSLCYLLGLYRGPKIYFVSPKILGVPSYVKDFLKQKKIEFIESEDLESALKSSDIIYMTRIQKERFKSQADYKKYFGKYILDKKYLSFVKRNAYIMHPLPRVNEISYEVDSDPRAIYFEQAKNGLYIRMALLLLLFDKSLTKNQ